ncbi:BQ2448_855 [Microbotryum intermedium]|uniref:BQ2448_855 protein n=1 Tax=Microbotryum intermedium TaxID=269621 RepID=A0A238FA34_9BASI|nr:BQ2448_855 [Microbotryum intermedium]
MPLPNFGSARLPTRRPTATVKSLSGERSPRALGFVYELWIMRPSPPQTTPKTMVASTFSTVAAPDSSSTSRPSHGNDVSWSGAERASHPPLKRSGSFNRDHDPSLPTPADESPRASTSLSSSTGTSRRPSAKRQRNRQQLSCVACHLRKQACDKVVPCSRCIKRGRCSIGNSAAELGAQFPRGLLICPTPSAKIANPMGVAHLSNAGRSLHVESVFNDPHPVECAYGGRKLVEFSARTFVGRVSLEKWAS